MEPVELVRLDRAAVGLSSIGPIPLLEGRCAGFAVARFREKVPAPEEPEARLLFAQVLRLVRVIEKVLGALMRLAVQLSDH